MEATILLKTYRQNSKPKCCQVCKKQFIRKARAYELPYEQL